MRNPVRCVALLASFALAHPVEATCAPQESDRHARAVGIVADLGDLDDDRQRRAAIRALIRIPVRISIGRRTISPSVRAPRAR